MYTNQAALPEHELSHAQCHHEPGKATVENCRYLRALKRLHAWVDRAEQAHACGDCKRESIGELWLINAELAHALDHCPNHTFLHGAVTDDYALAHDRMG